jgi:peptide/nickel transport system ATP-binding protein
VVAKLCDTVAVMHAGRILESAPADRLFAAPGHPYTQALLAATPRYDRPATLLTPIPEALTERLWREAREHDARGRA